MHSWLLGFLRLFGIKKMTSRQRLLYAAQGQLPDDVFALVRITRFSDFYATNVLEVKLIYGEQSVEELAPGFRQILVEALKNGADVSVITDVSPVSLGICEQ
jgi:hypothetical protein